MSDTDDKQPKDNLPPEDDAPNNVASFFTGKTLGKEDVQGISSDQWKDFLVQGIDAFNGEINKPDTKAFISIIFDELNRPKIIWAGDIEIISVIGALELAKNDFLVNTFSKTDDE